MNLHYEIPDDVWWRPNSYSYTNKNLAQLVQKHLRTAIKYITGDDCDHFLMDDFESDYRLCYVRDCLVGEGHIQPCPIEFVERTVKRQNIPGASVFDSHQRKMIINMFDTLEYTFPKLYLSDVNMVEFNVNMANRVHSLIAADHKGSYRRMEVQPYGESFPYLPFDDIQVELDRLFCITRHEMIKIECGPDELTVDQIERVVKIAAYFLDKFLYIHPYMHENGCVSRILASFLLAKISVIPVSLTQDDNKYTYLQCVRDAHLEEQLASQPPMALATLLLERVFASVENFLKALDINFDLK